MAEKLPRHFFQRVPVWIESCANGIGKNFLARLSHRASVLFAGPIRRIPKRSFIQASASATTMRTRRFPTARCGIPCASRLLTCRTEKCQRAAKPRLSVISPFDRTPPRASLAGVRIVFCISDIPRATADPLPCCGLREYPSGRLWKPHRDFPCACWPQSPTER